ncbi:NAD-dependent epimerase/dehydratase (fragment) [Parafrankia sp. Ea1.12]
MDVVTDPAEPGLSAYVKSKTLAERAAWDFVRREGGTLELAVINPVGIFGPVLGADYASSIDLVRRLLAGAMPAIPRLYSGVVDVRAVAELHLLAMNSPAAAGQRFLAVAGDEYSLPAIAGGARRGDNGAVAAALRGAVSWCVDLCAVSAPARCRLFRLPARQGKQVLNLMVDVLAAHAYRHRQPIG